ncbi:hypothetical protein DFH07DRAFT_952910 [Mycena maculata]|uniref:Uncharacterized protein n=1 Tax=Mycena maculata TaxID=230809 RepID=A0AAD7K016_9AGAR|nr:hypothetical protein DFH07DRAFT_952910 [Mycena maculata]
MIFSSSLVVAALGLFASASPMQSRGAEPAARQTTVPNMSVAPLTIFSVFQTLKIAVDSTAPGIESIATSDGGGQTGNVAPFLSQLTSSLNTATSSLSSLSPGDAGAANEDIATLVEGILDELNTALNGLLTQLDLDGPLTAVDGALSGLLTTLNAILPGVLALVGGVLVPVGGVVGGLLNGLGLSDL